MESLPSFLLLLPVVSLLLWGMIAGRWANRHPRAAGKWTVRLAAWQLATAVAAGGILGFQARSIEVAGQFTGTPVALVYWDGVAWLMSVVVSFVGWAVCRYSARYLDGEKDQGAFFGHVALTLGAVVLMTVAGNLLLLVVAWTATSFGLHRLLTHYAERPGARAGAWMKFVVSRLGDVFLLVAVVLVYREFGTFNFADIFDAVETRQGSLESSSAGVGAIVWFLILGAAVKSAQFPFHFWLPETMETPTPVSALMHAGIVNAGGFLVIRVSPLTLCAPEALTALAAIGATTAVVGGVAMLAQTSVKRTLAYSTIAQMGFMMLQCGIGAFSAAMLHIILHSLYKAYAFLASGEALEKARGMAGGAPARSTARRGELLALAGAVALCCYLGAMAVCGLSPLAKPGALFLGGLLCLALAKRLWQLLAVGDRRIAIIGVATTAGLALAYAVVYGLVDAAVGPSVPTIVNGPLTFAVLTAAAAMFVALLRSEITVAERGESAWRNALYVHAMNGFYVEAAARRLGRAIES